MREPCGADLKQTPLCVWKTCNCDLNGYLSSEVTGMVAVLKDVSSVETLLNKGILCGK